MKLGQYIEVSFANLITSRLRTILAMLGILVGTASVVAMVSSGELATQQALAQFKALGTDLLSVEIYSTSSQSVTASKIPVSFAAVIPSKIPEVTRVAPYTTVFADVSFKGHKIGPAIIGATSGLQKVINIQLHSGRFISFLDQYDYFCIIGHGVYQQIKPFTEKVMGQQILIGGKYFTIIGIAKDWPQNSFFTEDINQSIIIPFASATILSKYATLNNIVMDVAKNVDIDKTEKRIQDYFNQSYKGKRYFFRSAKQIIASMKKQKQILTLLLGLIGSISLLVGGIGVMNIMLVSVIERRREIGIRRALGAKQRDIQLMFLTESVMLSLFGGLFGVITGILIAFIIAEYANWHFTVFLLPPLVGFTVSVMIGIFFGYYPARKAARLDPIETLRSE